MRSLGPCLLSLVLLAGCAYRRHTTPLHTATNPKVDDKEQPSAMYTFRVLDALVPQTKISGLAWDDDGSAPDAFARLYVDGRLLWTSTVETDQPRPEWNAVLPHNIVVGSDSRFRLELWDYDTAISADPLGYVESMGLPQTVLPDAIARLQLDNKATVTVMISAPKPHRGVGLSVEMRSDAMKVIGVKPYSPASRAGIHFGDSIVGIGEDRISHMNEDEAISRLSLAAERGSKLVVVDATTKVERDVTLDKGYIWLVL